MFFQHGAAMKRFTFKGVLDNFRQSVSQPTKSEQPELVETLKTEHCQLARTARHGFPHQPTALAYDPIQRLVAIGTKSGAIRILGRPGVSVQVRHDPVPDPAAAGSGARGADVTGAAASSVSAGAAGGGDVPGGSGGVTRGSNAGLASGSVGINHHSGAGAGPGGVSNPSSSGGGSASSLVGTGGATGGQYNTAGSSAPGAAGQSGNVPPNHASGSGHHPSHGTFSTTGPAVIQLQFLINEGALVSATSDDSLHLWNIRQKRPDIVHSLKFQRERITCFHLPFQSKWLYVGTERGNVHIVNIESFSLSGYVINWNKAIELSCKTHPGPVIHISDCPTDPSKLLMGFESGLVVLWDLRTKVADSRFIASEPLRSVSWLSDGKQLISAHTDGSLYTWNSRAGPRPAPVSVTYPHAKGGREGKPECKAIQKVEWKSSTSGDPFVIFSGGLPQDRPGRSSSITVVHGRNTTVLEMEHNVVDFVALCDTPWTSAEEQDPHAIIVLLQNDLVIVDLLTPGFPCFENPYPMDIHESAVTCCLYMADCPGDLIPALYSVGAQGHTGFSKREWPINGGQWGSLAPSYAEIIVTGHVDGTVKFWDTSSLSLQVLYRLKTSKVFEKSRSKTLRPDGEVAAAVLVGANEPGKQHLAIKQLAMCPENRLLAIAGASGHVALFKFRRQEVSLETTVLGVPLFFDSTDEPQGSPSFGPGAANLEFCLRKEQPNPLSVRGGVYRRPPGFQVDLVCLSSWMDGEAPGSITSLSVNSAYGLMAYGNDGGLVLIDIIQKSVLLSMASVDLYSSADPYTRLPRSPKRPTDSVNSRAAADLDDNSVRSPSCDQNEVVEQSVDEVDTIKPSSECLETEVDRAVEALADDSEPNQPEATTEEEGGKTENGARQRKKKNNFNLKKQLSKADTKLRDLFAPVSRRGSGASTGTGGGGGGASGTGGLVSPHLLPDSKPVSPQEEHPAFHFPEPANCNAALPPLPPLAASGDSPVDSAASRTNPEIPLLFDSDGNPIRPPRRLKKSLSAAAATCQPKSVGNRDSGWKRSWYSSDSDSTAAATATAAMAALAPPAPMQVLDLRFDPSDECCHTGFLDSLSRNGSCTSPTSAAGNYRGSRAGLEGLSSGLAHRSGGGGDPASSSGGGGNPGGGGGGPSSASSSSGVGGSGMAAVTGRTTRPDCVRRSKSQGTGSHHSYRDRLVRKMAFNSSCPANAKEEEGGGNVTSLIYGAPPLPPPHFQWGFESVDHYCGHNNGKLLDHGGRDEPAQQQPATRRSLLLLHHRHQSQSANYTSFDKSDTAFTRSRSSSTSSLENHPNEAVTTLTFADTLARKLDTAVSASLWVGTSQGSVLVIVINLAAPGEPRLTQPVMVSPSGSIFRVKGSMLCVAFIEPSGSLISNPSEPWRDETKEARDQPARTGAAGGVGNDALSSDDQYTVMVSEKQARVVSLPSQTCLYRVNLAPAEGAFAVTANVVSLKDGPCLATFLSNGHIQVFSLPSLRPLMDVEFTPLVELNFQTSRQNLVDPMLNIWAQQQTSVNEDSVKIARNFRFTSHGHGMYLCSPSEMEKFTISSAFASTLGDLMGEMFMPCEMPEPPKEGFFKGLFGGGVRPLDREELFGESTGKAGRGVARHIPGPAANLETLTYKAGSVAAEVQKTRQALNERGDKLGMLEDRTQRMANEAENFSNAAHQLMVRCRERKWYQL